MAAVIRMLFAAVLVFSGSASCGRSAGETYADDISGTERSQGKAKIEFREVRYDFGTVSHGEKLSYTFIYKNTGDAPLLIHSARADCGCTVPEYTDRPLEPGKEGQIRVVFDTRGFRGNQTKTVQLATNADNPLVTLALRAVIEY